MTRLEALKTILQEATRGPLHLTGRIDVALRIREVLDAPDCHMEAAAKLVQADPVLSAQVVAVANSVAYNPGRREISDVRSAVTRLGFATLRSLAAAHVVRQMSGATKTPEIKRLTELLWHHTTYVAALCRVIAKRVTQQDPESALFIGMVHEVGDYYLLSRAGEFPALLRVEEDAETVPPAALPPEDVPEEDDPAYRMEGELTLAVLKQLKVPATTLAVVEEYYRGYLALPPASMADTLLLAELLVPVDSPLRPARPEGPSARASIDAVVGESTLSEIMQESAEEIAALARALGT